MSSRPTRCSGHCRRRVAYRCVSRRSTIYLTVDVDVCVGCRRNDHDGCRPVLATIKDRPCAAEWACCADSAVAVPVNRRAIPSSSTGGVIQWGTRCDVRNITTWEPTFCAGWRDVKKKDRPTHVLRWSVFTVLLFPPFNREWRRYTPINLVVQVE